MKMAEMVGGNPKGSWGSKALWIGSLAHLIHDGFTDMIYVFFPLWQAQWALTFS